MYALAASETGGVPSRSTAIPSFTDVTGDVEVVTHRRLSICAGEDASGNPQCGLPPRRALTGRAVLRTIIAQPRRVLWADGNFLKRRPRPRQDLVPRPTTPWRSPSTGRSRHGGQGPRPALSEAARSRRSTGRPSRPTRGLIRAEQNEPRSVAMAPGASTGRRRTADHGHGLVSTRGRTHERLRVGAYVVVPLFLVVRRVPERDAHEGGIGLHVVDERGNIARGTKPDAAAIAVAGSVTKASGRRRLPHQNASGACGIA